MFCQINGPFEELNHIRFMILYTLSYFMPFRKFPQFLLERFLNLCGTNHAHKPYPELHPDSYHSGLQ